MKQNLDCFFGDVCERFWGGEFFFQICAEVFGTCLRGFVKDFDRFLDSCREDS